MFHYHRQCLLLRINLLSFYNYFELVFSKYFQYLLDKFINSFLVLTKITDAARNVEVEDIFLNSEFH